MIILSIVNGISSYILETDTKITIINNKINIMNYIDIGHFDSNKIIVKLKNKNIIIKGIDLVVSKLLDNEILITGDLCDIEFR